MRKIARKSVRKITEEGWQRMLEWGWRSTWARYRECPMSATDNPNFATLLHRYRRRMGLTQEDLAASAGLSTASVSLLERGVTQTPQKATVEMLSVALALSPEEATEFLAKARKSYSVAQDNAPQGSAETTYDAGLPVPLTSLLGREREQASLLELLGRETTRLLTL